MIVYLNHEWYKSWGGNIEFHKNPRLRPDEDEITSVEPLFNRTVIFETNNISWHGFPEIKLPKSKKHLSRKSFALYYYTHQREQAVKPHSTIYVERHLSDEFKVGATLTQQGLDEIKTLLSRRDQHLKRLYKTITAQTVEIGQLKTENLHLKTLSGEPNDEARQLARQMELLSYDETRLINRVQELENSTSWKITKPLRKLKRWLG